MNRVQEKLPNGSSGYNIVGDGFSQTFQRTLNLPAEKKTTEKPKDMVECIQIRIIVGGGSAAARA